MYILHNHSQHQPVQVLHEIFPRFRVCDKSVIHTIFTAPKKRNRPGLDAIVHALSRAFAATVMCTLGADGCLSRARGDENAQTKIFFLGKFVSCDDMD